MSPNTPELYKATNWAPHRQPLSVASSTSGIMCVFVSVSVAVSVSIKKYVISHLHTGTESNRRGGVSSGPVAEQDFGEVEHQGDDDDEGEKFAFRQTNSYATS